MKDPEKLESLLEKGIITQEEFDCLQRQRNRKEPSLCKNILSFILTIIAIGSILFGTCIMNIEIVDANKSLMGPLVVAWPLFPVVLFGWIAHKTKNAGMKWAAIFLAAVGALFVAAVAWPLFPVVLFGWIAHKTKNPVMKWAAIFLAVGALFVAAAATMMG